MSYQNGLYKKQYDVTTKLLKKFGGKTEFITLRVYDYSSVDQWGDGDPTYVDHKVFGVQLLPTYAIDRNKFDEAMSFGVVMKTLYIQTDINLETDLNVRIIFRGMEWELVRAVGTAPDGADAIFYDCLVKRTTHED